MKRFRFRLETLLQHRSNIEERERMRFSRIRGELLLEREHMGTLRTKEAETLADLAVEKSGKCDTQVILWFYQFLKRLGRDIGRSAERIEMLEKQLSAQKQIMIAATRNKKMIENLKDKMKREFLALAEKSEQKSIDEMIVTRFGLKP